MTPPKSNEERLREIEGKQPPCSCGIPILEGVGQHSPTCRVFAPIELSYRELDDLLRIARERGELLKEVPPILYDGNGIFYGCSPEGNNNLADRIQKELT